MCRVPAVPAFAQEYSAQDLPESGPIHSNKDELFYDSTTYISIIVDNVPLVRSFQRFVIRTSSRARQDWTKYREIPQRSRNRQCPPVCHRSTRPRTRQ